MCCRHVTSTLNQLRRHIQYIDIYIYIYTYRYSNEPRQDTTVHIHHCQAAQICIHRDSDPCPPVPSLRWFPGLEITFTSWAREVSGEGATSLVQP
jgi:hypothetical protein